MINLKNKESDVAKSEMVDYEPPAYPYGAQIHLEKEHLEQLGLSDLEVGDEVQIVAKAHVTDHSQHEHIDGDGHESMGFQITDIDIDAGAPEIDKIGLLYGGDD